MKSDRWSSFIYGSSKSGKENRASRTVNGVTETYTVDSGDKLTQVSVSGVATKTFGYDGAGRTTSIQTSAGTTTITYDFESRVTGITCPNASTNSFTYNGLDTRVGKTDSAGTATFRRMGAGVTAPVLGDGSASFTPRISERRGSTSSFYGADYLGTNSSLYSSGETVSATRQYDAFGNLTSSSGSSANPFGFAGNWGYQNDSDSGLKLLGHRYYDASTGRFLTRDPIKDGRNWYAYCANDPSGAVDPTGLVSLIAMWVAIGNLLHGGTIGGSTPGGSLIVHGGPIVLINPDRNVMTIGPIMYMDPETRHDLMNSRVWLRHEEVHVYQDDVLGDAMWYAYPVGYLVGIADEAITGISSGDNPYGHNHNPLEVHAELAAGGDYGVAGPADPIIRVGGFIYDCINIYN